ncbi:unnamed protein product [Amoebophrya sp. A120]|nr:unnamed protein product [Amoebophrya sp. A120]|eukprot:GSA120T00010642001.1
MKSRFSATLPSLSDNRPTKFLLRSVLYLLYQLQFLFAIPFWSAQERFVTESEYHDLVGFQDQNATEHLSFRDVFFVISTWYSEYEHAKLAKHAWLQNLWQVAFITDKKNDLFPIHQQDDFPPEEYPTIYEGKFVLWMRNTELPEGVKWVVVLPTVDAFIHLGHLYYFLKTHTPKLRNEKTVLENGQSSEDEAEHQRAVMFASFAPNTKVFDYDLLPCGPVILNRVGWDRMVGEITKRECPFVESNALSLGFCASTQGVTTVFTEALSCNPPSGWTNGLDLVGFLGLSQMRAEFDKRQMQVVDEGFPNACNHGVGIPKRGQSLPEAEEQQQESAPTEGAEDQLEQAAARAMIQPRQYFQPSTVPNLRSLVESFCFQGARRTSAVGRSLLSGMMMEEHPDNDRSPDEDIVEENWDFSSDDPEKLLNQFANRGPQLQIAHDKKSAPVRGLDRPPDATDPAILASHEYEILKENGDLVLSDANSEGALAEVLLADVTERRSKKYKKPLRDLTADLPWVFWVQEGLRFMYVNQEEIRYFIRQFQANYDTRFAKLVVGSVTEDNHILALHGLLLSPKAVDLVVTQSLQALLLDPQAVIVHSSKFVANDHPTVSFLPKTIYGTIATHAGVFAVRKLKKGLVHDLEMKEREHTLWFRETEYEWRFGFASSEKNLTQYFDRRTTVIEKEDTGSSSATRDETSRTSDHESSPEMINHSEQQGLADSDSFPREALFTEDGGPAPIKVSSNSTTGIFYIHGQNHIGITKSGAAGMREFRKHQVLFRSAIGYPIQLSNSTTVICDKTTIAEDITQLEVEEI